MIERILLSRVCRFVHLVQRFLLRILCSCRKVIADFEGAQSRARAFKKATTQRQSGGVNASEKSIAKEDVFVRHEDLEDYSQLQPIVQCLEFLEWLEQFLLIQLYPGKL